jgi:hypothetical protein
MEPSRNFKTDRDPASWKREHDRPLEVWQVLDRSRQQLAGLASVVEHRGISVSAVHSINMRRRLAATVGPHGR